MSNYNHARYLPDSLGHICSQSRPADQIVVIDDGSTDKSIEIIEDFARSYPNIEVLINETNKGLLVSIERALQKVRCDYFVWTASDDRLLPKFLERNMRVLERNPKAALSFSETTQLLGDTEQINRFATNASVQHIFDLSDLPEYLDPNLMHIRMRRAYLPIASNTGVVRVDLLREIGGFPKDLKWHADLFIYFVLAMRYGACVIPETLALIRERQESHSSNMFDEEPQTRVLLSILNFLGKTDHRDIRLFFMDCPSMLSPFGVLMLKILAKRPFDWDLFAPYFYWKIKEYKRGHQLNWTQVAGQFSKRAILNILGGTSENG